MTDTESMQNTLMTTIARKAVEADGTGNGVMVTYFPGGVDVSLDSAVPEGQVWTQNQS